MQPFVQALPLTALNDALRGVMLEGTGLGRCCPSSRCWRCGERSASWWR